MTFYFLWTQEWRLLWTQEWRLHSTLSEKVDLPLSTEVVPVQGIGGKTLYLSKTEPVTVAVGNQYMRHSFLLSPQCPINLLGRDLLQALKAQLFCILRERLSPSPTVRLTGARTQHQTSLLSCICETHLQEICSLLTLTGDWSSTRTTTHLCRPSVSGIHTSRSDMILLSPPSDLLHVTLFCDRDSDLSYQVWFNDFLEGQEWLVSSPGIVVGLEGVEQMHWADAILSNGTRFGPTPNIDHCNTKTG